MPRGEPEYRIRVHDNVDDALDASVARLRQKKLIETKRLELARKRKEEEDRLVSERMAKVRAGRKTKAKKKRKDDEQVLYEQISSLESDEENEE